MGLKVNRWCPLCHRTHAFYNGKPCERRKVIRFDLSNETPVSAGRMIEIAKEVVRTESNRLPGEVE